MARPPKDPIGGSVSGPGSMHLGLRLGKLRAEQLKARVAKANEMARVVGLPANITASGLVTMWIAEKLDAADDLDDVWRRTRALAQEMGPELGTLQDATERKVRESEAKRAVAASTKRRRK